MPDNYQSASEVQRNVAQLTVPFEVLETQGKFRIIRLQPPYWGGSEFWVINEKGFFWEPVRSLQDGESYLLSEEACEYNAP